MKLFLKSRGSGGSRRRQITGLAVAASLILPTGLVAAGIAASPASAQITPAAIDGSAYTPITPCRLADTRANSGLQGQGNTLTGGHILHVVVANNCGVPDASFFSDHTVTAVVVNITAINPSQAGWLKAYGSGQPAPSTSSVNFVAGQTIANEATVTVGGPIIDTADAGAIDIANLQGSVDVAVDVQGFYSVSTGRYGEHNKYYTLAPFRVLDTRPGSGQQGQGETLGAGQQISFFPGTRSFLPWDQSVPVDATAVVVNLTATNNTGPGFLTAWANGGSQPLASNLNWPAANTTIPNRAIIPINQANGEITVFSNIGTDVVVDVVGFYSDNRFEDVKPPGCPASTNTKGMLYFPLVTPQRVVDTRAGSGIQGGNQPLGPGATRLFSIPDDSFGAGPHAPSIQGATCLHPRSVVINNTLTNTTASSFLTVYPGSVTPPTAPSQPLASDNNWTPGEIISNADQVGVGSLGEVYAYNHTGNADLVIDLFGYFTQM